jgi:hypothetical protein
MPGSGLRHEGRMETTAEESWQNQLYGRCADAFFEKRTRGRL